MPDHDLVSLWEAHCRYEFETRDVDATMATMVAEPYVNHVPTMTGGVGHDPLKRFYKHHFIGGNPPDTVLEPVSRTVGEDQIVDEMVFKFTHTSEVDWMLPGVKPTGSAGRGSPDRHRQVCRTAKVAHEHIYWDQASVLVQVGAVVAGGPARGGRGGDPQGDRQDLAQQRAHDAVERKRRQADLKDTRSKITFAAHEAAHNFRGSSRHFH